MFGHVDSIRMTKGATRYTWADDRRCMYHRILPWTIETATTHKLGEWGEWVEIPFLFIPKRSYYNKWVWGRGIYMRIKPNGVSYEQSTIDANVQYDIKRNIFKRKLKGVE